MEGPEDLSPLPAVEFLRCLRRIHMAEDVKGIPEGASVVIPRLFCRDVAAEIDFCEKTFGAVERVRRPGPDGTVAHALLMIGPAMIMIEGEWTIATHVEETIEPERKDR